ncbi:hypothetical protein AIOL_003687 [Candidatus Rhodobacter oscarellae]|uniref:Choline-sulfatase n=1 Tax=Candidatus Rhodobacter oscarellae TaxID=1675527 RepID=A0A0J9GZ11_9RHOB|nr:hypothetical protein [Candidatus Rhodobacter lobularis]KMW58708.1 hypothetical protein AIOL_003687 [Candidatus Rhodobacter lobularis]
MPFPAPDGHWPATNDGNRNRHAARYDGCPMDSVPRRGLSAEAVRNFMMGQAGSGRGLDFSMLMRAPNAPDLPDALYDLSNDPGEEVNLADDPAHAGVVRDLSARIDAYFARHSRPDADLWSGRAPIQNSMLQDYWRGVWGQDWAPVFAYQDAPAAT